MIWLRKLECQSWGSGGKGVSVVGVGVVRSVKKRWLREGWRHARKTVLLDWGSGISSRRRWVHWRNWRAAWWRNWWQNAGLPMGAPRRRMPVVISGMWVGGGSVEELKGLLEMGVCIGVKDVNGWLVISGGEEMCFLWVEVDAVFGPVKEKPLNKPARGCLHAAGG